MGTEAPLYGICVICDKLGQPRPSFRSCGWETNKKAALTLYNPQLNVSTPKFTGTPSIFSTATDRKSIMASSVVIDYHKLPTTFHPDHVQHTTYRSDAVLGRRRVKVVQNWYRDQELGRGSFGTVFLEKTWEGECRAVKDVAKGRDGARTVKVDYRRELMAMATLAKVREIEVPRTLNMLLANQIVA